MKSAIKVFMSKLLKIKKLKILVLVTARKNSKRIKNKNIIKIKGNKTLIDYTFSFIKKNLSYCNTLVSTDSNIIKKSALKHKLICPWLRPKRLSSDETKSIDVIIHAIKWYEKNYHKINTIILLQPTSPFRKVQDLNNTLNMYVKNYKNNKKISVISCKKSKIFPTLFKIKNNIIYNVNKNFVSPNGSFYVISRDKIIEDKKIYGSNTYVTIIKGDKFNLDINDYYDLKKAKEYL